MKNNITPCGLLFIFGCFLFSCSSHSIKEKINKTGDAAGQAIGEFAQGVTTGVKKVIEPKFEINETLKTKGIEFGKMTISSDNDENKNVLISYVIFNADFTGTLTAKAFDNKNLEMGRVKLEINGKKEDAKYFEFHFDKRTDIKNDSKITIE